MNFPLTCARAAALLAALLGASAALAAWPDDRPIELVVGFAPGGGTDTIARALARSLEKKLGANARVVVINKPGAGGELAAAQVAAAKPDGYTLGTINVPGFIFIPMTKKTAYQPEQLRLIARLVDDPALIIARRDGNMPKTLPAMVQALKKDPKSLSFGHAGEGTTGHLASMQLDRQAGTHSNSVPFKGAADAKLALLGGHVDYVICTTGEALEAEQENSRLQAVALMSDKRTGKATLAREAGYDIRISSERGIGAPAALPDDIARRLQDAIAAVLKDPAFIEGAKGDAPVLAYLPGDEWQRRLLQSREALLPLVPLMGGK